MTKEDLSTDILLSVIITTYNVNEYTEKLLDKLKEQINLQVEVIVVDDHSDIPLKEGYYKYIYLENNSGTPSKTRNIGLDNAKGKYITFIDGDDMITEDYIQTLLEDIKEDYDYYVYRWYPNDMNVFGIWHMEDIFYNWNVWSYMYKREIIGDIRFDETMVAGEDLEWLKRVLTPEHKRKEREKAIYRYNTENQDSISHLLAQGKINLRIEN